MKPSCELELLLGVCLHHKLYYDQLTSFIWLLYIASIVL